MKSNFIVVDLETTGLNPKTDKIIEIGALKIQDGEISGSFSELVKPDRMLEPRITEITGITDADLDAAPYIEEILPAFLEFAGDADLMGHSVLFDYSFLKKAAVNQKLSFERNGIDTLRIARRYLAGLESRSLPFLCRHFGISHNPHRALSDVEATFELYRRLWNGFYREDMPPEEKKIFEPVRLVYQVKREQPATARQIERLKKLLAYHNVTADCNINRMTRNEASRYADRLTAQFGRLPREDG